MDEGKLCGGRQSSQENRSSYLLLSERRDFAMEVDVVFVKGNVEECDVRRASLWFVFESQILVVDVFEECDGSSMR